MSRLFTHSKAFYLLFFFGLLFSGQLHSQIEYKNFIRETVVVKKGLTEWYQVEGAPIGEKLQTTTYLDGLGRPIQTVDKEVSPSFGGGWKDIVKHYEYDEAGRAPKDFIAYATSANTGKFKTDAASEQPAYIRNYFSEPATAPTYSIAEYDNSPLNIVTKTMEPGQSWGGNNVGTSLLNDFDFNYDWEKVHIWTLDYTSQAMPITGPAAIYPTGTLSRVYAIDEKGNKVITYTDKSGNIILKKVQELTGGTALTLEHAGWVCTYYVYDDFGQLRFIITPKTVKYLDETYWTADLTQAIVDELCYYYLYDERGRPIIKKQPGAGETSFVYDKKDRLVLSQDANQKAKGQWSFNLYDDLNRVAATGLFDNVADRIAMQSHVNSLNNGIVTIQPLVRTNVNFSIKVENPVVGSTGSANYCNGCNPSTILYNTITHFDDYSFGAGVIAYNSNNILAYNSASNPDIEETIQSNRTTGMVTGEKVRILDSDNNPYNDQFLFSTAYYDEAGRSLQNLSENLSLSIDYSTNQYDFSGKLVSSFINHLYATNFTVTSRYEYDNIGRLIKLYKNFNNTFYKQLVEYNYSELGQLKNKRLAPGYTATGKNEIESFNYEYNIRGWLTGINKDYALSTSNYNQFNNYFGLFLGYDNTGNQFLDAQFNGNTTGVIWKSQGDNSPRKFDYTYDRLDRLTSALFKQKKKPGDGWSNAEVDFSAYMEYEDGNGNIKSMKHKGIIPGIGNGVTIDDLNYTYQQVPLTSLTTNKLIKVDDVNSSMGQNDGLSGDFKNGVNTGEDYVYDVNGNLVKDFNKNIVDNGLNGITYNFLNKPEKIVIEAKSTIEYTYDATGEKLKKKITYTDNSYRITTYIGDFIYEQFSPAGGPAGSSDLQFVLHEEGRLKIITPHAQANGIDYALNAGNFGISLPGGKQGVFEYFIKDNLGSTRMVLTEEVQKEFYTATMEQSASGTEAPLFGAVQANGQPAANNELNLTRISGSPWPGNSTDVVKLTATDPNRKIGPNLILKVMAGDIINTKVDYFYYTNNATGGGNPVTSLLNSLLGALSVPKTGVLNHNSSANIYSSLSNNIPFSQFITNPSQTGNTPKAYLTIIFLDEQFKFIEKDPVTPDVGSDMARVSQANTQNAYLLKQQIAPKNGWVFVYVSNESNENVYFDNLIVTQEHSRIAEEAHYYPFGLIMSGISSKAFNKLENKYGYQGDFSEKETETGWDEFLLRNYDPQIGRWTGVDPYDEFASPYIGMGNDPVNYVDPDGGKGRWIRNLETGEYLKVPWIKGIEDLVGSQFENWEYIGRLGFGAGFRRAFSGKKFFKLESAEWDNNYSVDFVGFDLDGSYLISATENAMLPGRRLQLRSGIRNVFNEVPVIGSLINSGENFLDGNWKAGVGNLLMAGVDYLTLGSGTVFKKGVKEGAELLSKEALKTTAAKGVISLEKASGSYLLEFQSGKFYAGKGLESRMKQSINRIETNFGDKLINKTFIPASSSREAFIQEYKFMLQTKQVPLHWNKNSLLYNKIWSPGKKLMGH